MRGLPYTVVEEDIVKVSKLKTNKIKRKRYFLKFFPSSCQPIRIEIVQDRRMNRSNGDAYVYFNTMDEVNEAMKCDRKYMGKNNRFKKYQVL
jgi:RNA recognition motif-containing protein